MKFDDVKSDLDLFGFGADCTPLVGTQKPYIITLLVELSPAVEFPPTRPGCVGTFVEKSLSIAQRFPYFLTSDLTFSDGCVYSRLHTVFLPWSHWSAHKTASSQGTQTVEGNVSRQTAAQ